MSKIKIVSNPYQKATMFLSWDVRRGQWIGIDPEKNTNSRLLSEELRIGFFPFKVKQIVDIINTEYASDSEKVEIVFEGTDDEYRELESICSDNVYQNQVLSSKSSLYLENARDILPDIIAVFKNLRPLVADSVSEVKIKRELEKFSDASNDTIPICVIGNYSSGKSTFINALIGYELLPSSDEPTTAKIYKISQSKQSDRASVEFKYGDKMIQLRFTADSYKFVSDLNENPLTEKLTQALEEIPEEVIPVKLSIVLDIINDYANKHKDNAVSDLIVIEAPFKEDGLWGTMWSNFVIFDTPGSNSASNAKHYQVLKRAMEDLSNGLPVFVSEYDTLDSTDNDKLYQEINNMDELDNRFTMIIVNKADSASLKKTGHTDDDRNRILSLAIPRKLYSGGVFFVSSVIGLGAKNDEVFISEHSAEIYDDQKIKYIDPKSKYYKQLYRYNIMPEQIRRKYNLYSEKHGNLLYANSGLCCIEQAIGTFAGVYSHYNKCQQSHLFLGKVIRITSDEILDAKSIREKHREHTHMQLEKEKSELIDWLNNRSSELEARFIQEYPMFMTEPFEQAKSTFTYDSLKEKEEDFRRAEEADKNILGHKKEVSESWISLWDGISGNISDAVSDRSISSIRKIGTGIADGLKDIAEKRDDRKKAKSDVEKATSEGLISFIRESFTSHVNEAQKLLENNSRSLWEENAEGLKRVLSQIVTDSTALTTEKRRELADIIIEYQDLTFESKAAVIFDREKFRRRFFGDTTRLDIEKLARRYNSELNDQITLIYGTFKSSHERSFKEWMENLLATIEENIIDLNPHLHIQAEIIREETARIAELESRLAKLNDYKSQVKQMMDWKED